MSRARFDEGPPVAQIPADIDQPDKILYGFTARQALILAVTGLACAALYALAEPWLPLPVIAGLLIPVVAFGSVVAVARRDGLSLDAFALAALAHTRATKEHLTVDERESGGQPLAAPRWCRMRGKLPAPLRLPVRAVRSDGVLELADGGGTAVLVQAGTIPFGLRTSGEQAGLVAGFGRWLNSLESSTQILVHARPVDLTGLADHIADRAPGLPDPALEQAALDHAAFLDQVSASYTLLSRQVLIVIRDTTPAARAERLPGRGRRAARRAGAAVVQRRAAEAVRALGALGITAQVLDAPAATAALAHALTPGEPAPVGTAEPGEAVTTSPAEFQTLQQTGQEPAL